MIKEMIARVVVGKDVNETEMMTVMTEIMEGEATPAQIAAFMTALRIKGETVDEVTGAARIMRREGHPHRRLLLGDCRYLWNRR